VKSSGSIWFVYGVAVVVTFTVGLLSFTVFVLAKVFAPGSPDQTSAQPPATSTVAPDNSASSPPERPTTTPTPTQPSTTSGRTADELTPSTPQSRDLRNTTARVLAIRAVASNPRQLVLTVATPTGCAQKLRATQYAEGPGAIAVRVTQQMYREGCEWREKAILTTSSSPIADRTIIVNGIPWTNTPTGRYELALRTPS
jgi:hypothetical protein